MSDDLIRRSDAIEVIENTDWYHQNRNKDMVSGANSDEHQAWYKAEDVYKALEAVPSADRPSAVDLSSVYSTAYKSGYDKGYADAVQGIADEMVKQGKCIVQDRPQGEWIDAEIPLESGGSMPIQACSLCKTFYPLAYTGGGHRFCPNCGARMKGADDE